MTNLRTSAKHQPMTLDAIHKVAPSVFAQQPYEKMSDKYRFIPTSDIVASMMKEGFQPVAAKQSLTRIEGKGDFTKHQLRFRHQDFFKTMEEHLDGQHNRLDVATAPEIAELILTNSHDGTSGYILDLGFFRLVCSNGLMVQSGSIESVRARHTGREDLVAQVIEGSFKVIEEAPKAIEQIAVWKGIQLERKEQEALAAAALEIRDTALEVPLHEVLYSRRHADSATTSGSRDLWRTMNVVQENLVKGGIRGQDAKNNSRRLRSVKAIDSDTKLNKALWLLTEKMGQLKTA